ncbi:MAG: VWA domain-containing protein [Deltaproteobacteria bacterium]|nr:MAG: VWA domain-containing protein [Deltaproteobacteria bacterium]TMQ13743.1 MAG: VWA domain-containing protein [Deltaproteobacteria bacterium]
MTADDSALAGRYAFIDAVPDALLDAVVANAHGKLRPRAEAIVVLRDALLAGRIPLAGELAWPDAALRQPLLDALARSGVAAHCAANAGITDQVLAGLLGATDQAQRHYDELLAEWTLAARERDRRTRTVGLFPGDGPPGDAVFDEAAWQRLRDDAARLAGQVALEALAAEQKAWDEQARDWARLRALLDELCEASGSGRTRLPGVLHAIDWRNSTELRGMLAGLPAMRSLARAVGRGRAPDAAARTVLEAAGGEIRREVIVERDIRELGHVEIRGVERSDEVSRMLASEAALRLLPATHLLWHARRAERALLTYHAESLYTTRIATIEGFRDGGAVEHVRAERGPVIILLDSSGSMAGRPEILARAVILQVMCVCELDGRRCYLYNFSGDGDLIEHELAFTRDGLAHAMAVLALSFAGGTVIDEPLRRAVLRIQSEAWAAADILIVTDGLIDGDFDPFDGGILRLVERARRTRPFRIHVALAPGFAPRDIGDDPELCVVRELADEIHDLEAWVDDLVPSN